jgi:hypothetical protein
VLSALSRGQVAAIDIDSVLRRWEGYAATSGYPGVLCSINERLIAPGGRAVLPPAPSGRFSINVAEHLDGIRLLEAYEAMNCESLEDVNTHFRKLVAGELPEDSCILVPRGGGALTIFATWGLPGHPSRGTERSRMIRIAITQGALEDYAGGNNRVRLASNRRFVAGLRRQIAAFNPHQDSPLHIEPPPVTWPIGTRELNG